MLTYTPCPLCVVLDLLTCIPYSPSHNVWEMDMGRFEQLMSKPLGPHGIDLTVLQPFRLENLRDSIKNNPYFWQGPYTKLAIEPATYIFTYRFFGNWSADADDGYLSRENYATFMGVEGEPGNYKYKQGHERIPENVSLPLQSSVVELKRVEESGLMLTCSRNENSGTSDLSTSTSPPSASTPSRGC